MDVGQGDLVVVVDRRGTSTDPAGEDADGRLILITDGIGAEESIIRTDCCIDTNVALVGVGVVRGCIEEVLELAPAPPKFGAGIMDRMAAAVGLIS